MRAGEKHLALADSAAENRPLPRQFRDRLRLACVDEPAFVSGENLHIRVRDGIAGNGSRSSKVDDCVCRVRRFKRRDSVVCERNLYRRIAAVVGGIVILERNHIETRKALYRLLHREKRTRADAIVLSTLTDETFKRRRAIVAD